MSRCFPFPPPGYEKKTISDETDLSTKEKHKEKKHKKDKKDKEKKEGKEKKDKEKSKDKHKEKKEKKEKHKDKKDSDRDKEKSRAPDDKRAKAPADGEKLGTNFLQNRNKGDSKYVQDLARRIRNEETATGSQVVQKIKIPDQRSGELQERTVKNNSCYPFKETNHKREDDKTEVSGRRNFAVTKISEYAVERDLLFTDQKRVEATVKPVEKKDVAKQMEGKETTGRKEIANKSYKTKDKDQEKKDESKVKDGDIETKKEERVKEVSRPKQEQPNFIEGGPRLKEKDRDSLDIHNGKPPELLRASNENLASNGNLSKRKVIESNGILYVNGNRPNKLEKPVSSSLPAMENGRKLPQSQIPTKSTTLLHGAISNCKPEIREHRVNGFIETKQPKVLSPVSLPSTVQVNENGEALEKPPHPDSKYLSQMLSILKREPPEFDDQEWLFGSTRMKPKRPKTGSPGYNETQRTWDRALKIESADILALPYVVPY